jgi:hypothetical protein
LSWLKKEVGADLGDLYFGTLLGGIRFRTGGSLRVLTSVPAGTARGLAKSIKGLNLP